MPGSRRLGFVGAPALQGRDLGRSLADLLTQGVVRLGQGRQRVPSLGELLLKGGALGVALRARSLHLPLYLAPAALRLIGPRLLFGQRALQTLNA